MLTYALAAFAVFGLVIVGMAVGVIFSNRRIQGSCGGLNTMRDDFGRPMCECGSRPGECGDAAPAASSKEAAEVASG